MIVLYMLNRIYTDKTFLKMIINAILKRSKTVQYLVLKKKKKKIVKKQHGV